MTSHLGDEQWAAALLGPAEQAVAEHLRECATCRAELSSLEAAIGAARAGILKAAVRPETFWREQRTAISTRLARRALPLAWKRLAWIAASIVLILLSTSLLSRRNESTLRPEPAPSDSDDTLLLSVQQSIRSDLPQALWPAALLTQEINQATIVQGGARPAPLQGE